MRASTYLGATQNSQAAMLCQLEESAQDALSSADVLRHLQVTSCWVGSNPTSCKVTPRLALCMTTKALDLTHERILADRRCGFCGGRGAV